IAALGLLFFIFGGHLYPGSFYGDLVRVIDDPLGESTNTQIGQLKIVVYNDVCGQRRCIHIDAIEQATASCTRTAMFDIDLEGKVLSKDLKESQLNCPAGQL